MSGVGSGYFSHIIEGSKLKVLKFYHVSLFKIGLNVNFSSLT